MWHGVNCVVMRGWHVIQKIVMVLFFSETSSHYSDIVVNSDFCETCKNDIATYIAARLRVEWAGLGRETVN